jgi:hypothetical protein
MTQADPEIPNSRFPDSRFGRESGILAGNRGGNPRFPIRRESPIPDSRPNRGFPNSRFGGNWETGNPRFPIRPGIGNRGPRPTRMAAGRGFPGLSTGFQPPRAPAATETHRMRDKRLSRPRYRRAVGLLGWHPVVARHKARAATSLGGHRADSKAAQRARFL